MRYVMKEKILSWGDDFRIRDESGRDVFHVDGKVFSFGDKLSFRDASGSELAVVDQKLLSIGPTYEIYRGGALAAVGEDDVLILASAVVIDLCMHPDDKKRD